MPTLQKRFSYKNTIKLTLMDLTVLLSNLNLGVRQSEVGFEDANQTIEALTEILDRPVTVPLEAVESALWSCNLLDEQGKFFHPQERSFDSFIKGVEFKIKKKYNKLRNYFSDIERIN